MLMSAGIELPERVFGHGFVTFKGEKMSKSLGTIVDPLDAASKYGPDPLRLYLGASFAYGQDGDFSWERFEDATTRTREQPRQPGEPHRHRWPTSTAAGGCPSRRAARAPRETAAVAWRPTGPRWTRFACRTGRRRPTPSSTRERLHRRD